MPSLILNVVLIILPLRIVSYSIVIYNNEVSFKNHFYFRLHQIRICKAMMHILCLFRCMLKNHRKLQRPVKTKIPRPPMSGWYQVMNEHYKNAKNEIEDSFVEYGNHFTIFTLLGLHSHIALAFH